MVPLMCCVPGVPSGSQKAKQISLILILNLVLCNKMAPIGLQSIVFYLSLFSKLAEISIDNSDKSFYTYANLIWLLEGTIGESLLSQLIFK
jgi:hypothetical protein